MTTIVSSGTREPYNGDGEPWPSAIAPWTDEQAAYALFLKTACLRAEAIAVEIGIEPRLVGDFVRDTLITIHHAKHTQARDRHGEAWVEAIAHNLARKRRWGAAVRRHRMTLFWSLNPFARGRRHRERHATAAICGGAVGDVTTLVEAETANVTRRTAFDFLRLGARKAA